MPARPIEQVLLDHTSELMAIPGVEGTGQGERAGKPVIVVYASRPAAELHGVPEAIEGYGVEIRVIGKVRPLDDN